MNSVADITTKTARIIIKDEVECILAGLTPDHLKYFYNYFKVRAKGYFFSPRFKLKIWDGYDRYFSEGGKTFVILLEEIVPILIKLGYKLKIDDKRIPINWNPPLIDQNYFSYVDDPKYPGQQLTIRPYQVEAVNNLLRQTNGIILAGTGGGKTLVNAAVAKSYGQFGAKSITIVPNDTLVNQTINFFQYVGLDTGCYSGKKKDLDHQHIVSTWQALKNRPELITDFQVFFVDECHGAKATILAKLINQYGRKISFRFGFTGTMPDDKAECMKINASLGPIRYSIEAHTLIDEGWLATLNISIFELDDKQHLVKKGVEQQDFLDYNMEMDWCRSDERRMKWIVDYLVEKQRMESGNILCLISSVQYGKKIRKFLPSDAHFVYGKTKAKMRKQVYDLFENNDNIIVLATTQVAGVGLSIDRIFNLVIVDIGKSYIRVIQAIGRGLRKGVDKDHVNVTDICGNLKYCKQHVQKRIKFYKKAKYPNKKYSVDYTKNIDEELLP